MAGKHKVKVKGKGRAKKKVISASSAAAQYSKNKKPTSRTPDELDLTEFSEEITKQIETAFHIGDNGRVELSLPNVSNTEAADTTNQNDSNEVGSQDTVKVTSLKRRLRSFTGSSAKSVPAPERHSWNHQSPSKHSSTSRKETSRSLRSNSNATQSTTKTNNSVSSTLKNFLSPKKKTSKKKEKKRPEAKRSITAPPKFLKCVVSPHDYRFIDLDFGKRMEPALKPGLLPRMKDASRQISTKPIAPGGSAAGEYHRVVLGVKIPARAHELAKGAFEELVEYVRSVTGTQVKIRDLSKSEAHRVDDVRKWDSANLRCISCQGDCPVCGTVCCVYENARRTVAQAGPDADGTPVGIAAKAHQILKIIDSLGTHAKDATTFSLCSQPGGCGRYVCPGCCGVCPSEICLDIQCKECKPDPWGTCDWHD